MRIESEIPLITVLLVISLVAPGVLLASEPVATQLGAAPLTTADTAEAPEAQRQPVPSAFTAGNRVRIRSTGMAGQTEGIVASVDSEVLTLMSEGEVRTRLPLASITSAEMRVSQKRHPWIGLGVGVLAGAVITLVASHAVGPRCDAPGSPEFCFSNSASSAMYAAAGLGTIGLGVGWLIKTEHWVHLQVNEDGLGACPRRSTK
jgi:hypothetical protein